MSPAAPAVLVVGAGPAGLMAAEAAAGAGARVRVIEAKPWPGRKFLVAGRGGLNLTHSEPLAEFVTRFSGGGARWPGLLAEFGPAQVRRWAEGLGTETYVGSSGRVFPREGKASRLLRAWLRRLGEAGVSLETRRRFRGFPTDGTPAPAVVIEGPAGRPETRAADAVVLALGGASWPRTGSDGAGAVALAEAGVAHAPWRAANCGYEAAWPPGFLAAAEGRPLKNIAARVAGAPGWTRGELMVTRYGLEGGLLYALGAALRAAPAPVLEIDCKPDVSDEGLRAKLAAFPGKGSLRRRVFGAWRLKGAARALAERGDPPADADAWVARVKRARVELTGPRPIGEAISSAGGLRWDEVADDLMLRRRPGVFVAGEMLDWDAPTGGYLLTGCLALGRRAGAAAAAYATGRRSPASGSAIL